MGKWSAVVYTSFIFNMASTSDSDDEETFVSLGTPLEVPDKDERPRKPVHLEDMQAKDSQGRARFHGAFTGGFSAGYFNSVGSKEGWTPSTFVSSRSNRSDTITKQAPEDYMDDEDVGEHGIAPRKLVTAGNFSSEERKRRREQEMLVSTSGSILPGESSLMDLIVPERITIGMKLLRKMGWKDGQGLGPRLSRKLKKKQKSSQKAYGCALPSSSDEDDHGIDDDTFLKDITYAPQDTKHILLAAKENTHGLGYRGINPHLALSSSSISGHVNLFEPPRITKTGRKGIRGQGFGVGALEEEDDDIYGLDDMSKYDMTMGGEEEDGNFGWTAPKGKGKTETPVGYVGRVLEGFKLSSTRLIQKKDFPPPQVPRDYRPVHTFNTPNKAPSSSLVTASTGVDYRQFLPPGLLSQDNDKGNQLLETQTHTKGKHLQLKDAASRSLALGESAFVGSVFDLISANDKAKLEAAKMDPALSQSGSNQTSLASTSALQEQTVPCSTQTLSESQLVPIAGSSLGTNSTPTEGAFPNLSPEEMRKKNQPLFQGAVGTFKPFMKDPLKQQRYEKYLELVKHGHKDAYNQVCNGSQTEWETEREKEEFAAAARLYKPLAGMMAVRFTSGGHNLDEAGSVDVKLDSSTDQSDAAKAAEMKMYGKLTRDVVEWHPDKLICKRFNVPDPYPGSNIVGLTTVKRDKYSVFNFLDFATPTSAEVTSRNEQEPNYHSPDKETDTETGKQTEKVADESKSMKSIFSHLMAPSSKVTQGSKSVSFTVKSNKTTQAKSFKSIFSHLEDETVKLQPKISNIGEEAMDVEVDKNIDQQSDSNISRLSEGETTIIKKETDDKEESQPPVDLFRAIFKNTDSENSSSSSDEELEAANIKTVIDNKVKAASETQMDTVNDHMASETDQMAGPSVSAVSSSAIKIEPKRAQVSSDSSEEDTFGPALPPSLKSTDDSGQDRDFQYIRTSSAPVVDLSTPPHHGEYVDLTQESSKSHKKHRNKDRHKSKKDKKEKHKKSKHKKKGRKKEKKKKERKYESNSTDTSDKDSDESDTELPSDRELLNKWKSFASSQRMKATDFI